MSSALRSTACTGGPVRRAFTVAALLIFAAWLAVGAGAAQAAEQRLALVIGNARYPALPLNNPENDARVMATTLRRLGFEVIEHVNLPVKEFRKVLRDYAKRLQAVEGASVFYYAGHGVQIDGRNFLLPVDVNLRDEDEVRDEGVDVDELFVSRLERARTQVRIVILDACRDNPFAPKTRAIRGVGGLAEMAARGALIAYASAPGATAEDGPEKTNSVYTRHLVKEMLVEGLEVEQMFKNVRVKVMRDTNQRQVPWVNTSLTADFSFNPRRGPAEGNAARRDDIALLQAKLDQREREQKELEEKLQRLTRKYERGEADAGKPTAGPQPARTETAPAPKEWGGRKASGTVQPAEPSAPPLAKASPVPAPAAPTVPKPVPAASAAVAAKPPPVASAAIAKTAPAAPAGAEREPPTKASKPASPAATVAADAQKSEKVARSRPDAKREETSAAPAVKAAKPERVAKVSGNAASERCVALLIRAQLGEPMPPSEIAYLQKECR